MSIDKEDVEWAISLLVTIWCTWYSTRKQNTEPKPKKKELKKTKEPKKHHQRSKRK